MPHPDHPPRVGRSQGASLFWGLVSLFFAAAACFYFWKDHEHEITTDKLRDEVLTLQDERDTLNSEKTKLQASMSEATTQLKAHEDFLDDKESKLAAEESRLDALGQQIQNSPSPTPSPAPSQTAVVKKFNDIIRKLGKDDEIEVTTRGGRPLLRVANSVFFAPGEAALKPEGKALLTQITQSLDGQIDHEELRVESFTDSDAEMPNPPAKPDPNAKPRETLPWELTAARAAAIERFFLNQTSLPFQNVLVIGRGDSEPIVPGAQENHARDRRVEITLTPVPVPFHPTDTPHTASGASPHPLPPDPSAPANKAR